MSRDLAVLGCGDQGPKIFRDLKVLGCGDQGPKVFRDLAVLGYGDQSVARTLLRARGPLNTIDPVGRFV